MNMPCLNCGWCCSRAPCPLAIYLGHRPKGPCDHMIHGGDNGVICGLLVCESDPIKAHCVEEIIFVGSGCTNLLGPKPAAIIRMLKRNGATASEIAKRAKLIEINMMDAVNRSKVRATSLAAAKEALLEIGVRVGSYEPAIRTGTIVPKESPRH